MDENKRRDNMNYKPKTYLPFLFDFEREIVEKFGIKETKRPVIAISGFSGVGKTIHGKLLKKKIEKRLGIKLKIWESGEIMREIAKKFGYDDVKNFIKNFKNDKKLGEMDRRIERETLEKMILEGGIFIGRMTCFVAGKWGFKIWIEASPLKIAERLSKDPKRIEFGVSIEKIRRIVEERNRIDEIRLERIYGIKFEEVKKVVDLIVNNDEDLEEVSEKIFKRVLSFLRPYI